MSEQQKIVIKNPTAQELDQIKKQKENENVFKDSDIPKTKEVESSKESSVKLKKSTSIFEPSPVPYKLITTNNIIKDNLSPSCEIYIRRMSGEDDVLLQSMVTESEIKVIDNMTKIIENCIKSDIDVKAIPLIEKIPLFLFVLANSIGDTFNAAPIPNCETCMDDTVVEMSMYEFKANHMKPNDENYPRKIKLQTYEGSDITIVVEMPKIGGESLFIKNSENKNDYMTKLLQIVKNIYGTNSDGKPIKEEDWYEILNYLNDKDKYEIKKCQDDWENDYGFVYKNQIKKCSHPSCSMRGKEIEFDTFDIIKKFILKSFSKR